MRSSRILDVVQNAVKPVSDYFTPIMASAVTTLSSFHASEPGKKSERVEMKATKSADNRNSSAQILERMKECASKEKKQPEIFIALLHKQELPADQVENFAVELAKNGKARELDALAGKYNLSREFVVETLRKADKPETYQELLEAKREIKNIGYLFDPNSAVTIVEASDKDTILAATLAARNVETKRIIKVDTTEEYSPHHKEDVVQRQENTPPAAQQSRLFKPVTVKHETRTNLLDNTNILGEVRFGSAVRHHV